MPRRFVSYLRASTDRQAGAALASERNAPRWPHLTVALGCCQTEMVESRKEVSDRPRFACATGQFTTFLHV